MLDWIFTTKFGLLRQIPGCCSPVIVNWRAAGNLDSVALYDSSRIGWANHGKSILEFAYEKIQRGPEKLKLNGSSSLFYLGKDNGHPFT